MQRLDALCAPELSQSPGMGLLAPTTSVTNAVARGPPRRALDSLRREPGRTDERQTSGGAIRAPLSGNAGPKPARSADALRAAFSSLPNRWVIRSVSQGPITPASGALPRALAMSTGAQDDVWDTSTCGKRAPGSATRGRRSFTPARAPAPSLPSAPAHCGSSAPWSPSTGRRPASPPHRRARCQTDGRSAPPSARRHRRPD